MAAFHAFAITLSLDEYYERYVAPKDRFEKIGYGRWPTNAQLRRHYERTHYFGPDYHRRPRCYGGKVTKSKIESKIWSKIDDRKDKVHELAKRICIGGDSQTEDRMIKSPAKAKDDLKAEDPALLNRISFSVALKAKSHKNEENLAMAKQISFDVATRCEGRREDEASSLSSGSQLDPTQPTQFFFDTGSQQESAALANGNWFDFETKPNERKDAVPLFTETNGNWISHKEEEKLLLEDMKCLDNIQIDTEVEPTRKPIVVKIGDEVIYDENEEDPLWMFKF